MKLHSSLLLFFLFFYFIEGMVRTVHYKNQRVDGRVANYTYFIRRGKSNFNEFLKEQRKSFDNDTEEGKEAIFGDVIKNITRVNNVLEELIKNYEKLKDIYKSQETFEQYDLEHESSDMEIDEKYKQRNIQAKESNNVLATKLPDGLATDMILEEKEETKVRAEVNNEDYKKGKSNMLQDKQEKRAPFIQFLRKPSKDKAKSEKVSHDRLAEHSTSSDSSSESDEIGIKGNEIQEITMEPKQKNYAIEFQLPRLERFSSANNSSPVMETVIKTEKYSPNYWDKLAMKAPINLRTEKVIAYGKEPLRNNYNNAISESLKKQENDQTRAVPAKAPLKFKTNLDNAGSTIEKGPVKTANYTTPKQMNEANLATNSIEWSVEDDKTIEKEQFKTSILRKAYGDACLQVIVKKCYKACQQVTKTGCVKYDCKQDFINAFKAHSKTGCFVEFKDETIIHKDNRFKAGDKDDDSMFFIFTCVPNGEFYFEWQSSALAESSFIDGAKDDFVDITRSGYLASACLPSKIRHKPMPIVLRTTGNITIQPQRYQLILLRDKFEIACQKVSAEKCKRACYYATNQVCSTYGCKVGKKSNLAKECRAHCKEAYRYTDEDISEYSDTDIETDDSSSVSENIYNDSRPDHDFEVYVNSSTTPSIPKNKNILYKSAINSDSIVKANLKLGKAFAYKKSFRNLKKLL